MSFEITVLNVLILLLAIMTFTYLFYVLSLYTHKEKYDAIKKLKFLSWDDEWENVVTYGQENQTVELIDRPYIFKGAGCVYLYYNVLYIAVLVMHQLKDKMSVYEAFLKGVSVWASLDSNIQTKATQNAIKEARKLFLKNNKKGIIDEELNDTIEALEYGYNKKLNSQKEYRSC